MKGSADCIKMIRTNLNKHGIGLDLIYEKKRKILESEVSDKAIKEMKISNLLEEVK